MDILYNFNEHKHRYAIWTAARAVQRSFTTTKIISDAINQTALREFSESLQTVSQQQFDNQHDLWCNSLVNYFKEQPTCSYGRAAKIVAIYLKTSVVLPMCGNTSICEVIHPPIDSILLNNLAAETSLQLKYLKKERWTQFGEEKYKEIVAAIRSQGLPFNWLLEKYWQPEREKNVTNGIP